MQLDHLELQILLLVFEELIAKLCGNGGCFALRLFNTHSLLNSAQQPEVVKVSGLLINIFLKRGVCLDVRRHVCVGRKSQREVAAKHADNRQTVSTEHDRLTNDLRIAAKPTLPQPVTQHD